MPSKYSKITESVTYTAKFVKDKKMWCKVTFKAGDHGRLIGETEIEVLKGTSWHSIAEPEIEADRGYRFVSWTPYFPKIVFKDYTFTANFEKDESMWHTITFVSGDNGSLEGKTVFTDILDGTPWKEAVTVPAIKAKSGYKFSKWDPLLPDDDKTITSSATYTAIFTKVKRSSSSRSSELSVMLNKEDHFAYIVGYPDGTVRRESYSTGEEVAAVFYRL